MALSVVQRKLLQGAGLTDGEIEIINNLEGDADALRAAVRTSITNNGPYLLTADNLREINEAFLGGGDDITSPSASFLTKEQQNFLRGLGMPDGTIRTINAKNNQDARWTDVKTWAETTNTVRLEDAELAEINRLIAHTDAANNKIPHSTASFLTKKQQDFLRGLGMPDGTIRTINAKNDQDARWNDVKKWVEQDNAVRLEDAQLAEINRLIPNAAGTQISHSSKAFLTQAQKDALGAIGMNQAKIDEINKKKPDLQKAAIETWMGAQPTQVSKANLVALNTAFNLAGPQEIRNNAGNLSVASLSSGIKPLDSHDIMARLIKHDTTDSRSGRQFLAEHGVALFKDETRGGRFNPKSITISDVDPLSASGQKYNPDDHNANIQVLYTPRGGRETFTATIDKEGTMTIGPQHAKEALQDLTPYEYDRFTEGMLSLRLELLEKEKMAEYIAPLNGKMDEKILISDARAHAKTELARDPKYSSYDLSNIENGAIRRAMARQCKAKGIISTYSNEQHKQDDAKARDWLDKAMNFGPLVRGIGGAASFAISCLTSPIYAVAWMAGKKDCVLQPGATRLGITRYAQAGTVKSDNLLVAQQDKSVVAGERRHMGYK